jgi:peptidoglycan/xylan/chitin deacetylase (PgdA/CDA1 family)
MIRLCFRFDDPSATSNHALERAIVEAFARRELAFTAAVIPFRQVGDETVALHNEHVQHLIEAQARGTVEVAQHGLAHVRRAATPAGKPSEFHSLPETEQRELIERGRAQLESVFGRSAAGFVPPWNAYDRGTLRALEDLGFRYVSAGKEVPGLSGTVATVPLTCWLHNLRKALAEAERFRALHPVVVAVFHHFDFKESGEQSGYVTTAALGELLDTVRARADVTVTTLAGTVESRGKLAFGVRCQAWRKRLPWRLRFLLPEHALLSGPLAAARPGR